MTYLDRSAITYDSGKRATDRHLTRAEGRLVNGLVWFDLARRSPGRRSLSDPEETDYVAERPFSWRVNRWKITRWLVKMGWHNRSYHREAGMGDLKTKLHRPDVPNPDRTREEWTQLLDELVHKIQGWLPKEEWSSKVIEKEMVDSRLGEYKAPALLMQRAFTRVMLEPITRFAPGTDGVVDLYKMPAYDDIAGLYRIEDEWKLHYAFRASRAVAKIREAESLDLDETNFLRVLGEISGHAE